MEKVALGTVQLGMPYGVANRLGMPTDDGVAVILDLARERGVTLLDTAQVYGKSEERLGHYLSNNPGAFDVVTKLAPQSGEPLGPLMERSLERLRVTSVYGLLLHSFDALTRTPGHWEELLRLREGGLAGRVGVSLYYPAEWEYLRDREMVPDLLQIPYSVIDRRFEPHFNDMRERGVELHCRSTFLQGAVFLSPSELPQGLGELGHRVERLAALAEGAGSTVAALALGFAARDPRISRVVIGVESPEQLEENLASLTDGLRALEYIAEEELAAIRCADEDLVVPARWPK